MSWFDTWHQDMRSNVRVKNTNIQVEQQQQQRQLQQVIFIVEFLLYNSCAVLRCGIEWHLYFGAFWFVLFGNSV